MNANEDVLGRLKALRSNGDLAKAERLAKETIDRDRGRWSLWNELGHILVAKNASFRQAATLEPERSGIWNNIGFTLKMMADLNGAIEAAEKAELLATTEIDQKSARYNLACYLSLSGRTDEAIDYLQMVCSRDPSIREWARSDDDLNPIRSDPRFQSIVE
ncbi:MAG: TPR end-of-group domain-containing protein [Candidatus Thorarchaeota archaeon]|jgi:Flp pilus assembly protein TadD